MGWHGFLERRACFIILCVCFHVRRERERDREREREREKNQGMLGWLGGYFRKSQTYFMLNIRVEDILDCREISLTALIAQKCTKRHVKYCFALSTHNLLKNTTVSVAVCLGCYIHFLKHAGLEADFFLLVCAGDSHSWRYHVLGLSIHTYVRQSVTF